MAKKLNPWTDLEPTIKDGNPPKMKYRRVGDRVEIVGTLHIKSKAKRKKKAKRK